MTVYRKLTDSEIRMLVTAGNTAEDWAAVEVAEPFDAALCVQSRFEGRVRLGAGARVVRSTLCNYVIGAGAAIEGVTRLECRTRSRFGNGVGVATINECGGRRVKIYAGLRAQTAYLLAHFRHRTEAVAAIERMIEQRAEAEASEMGRVGVGARIIGARLVREVAMGDGAVVEGAALLENGTLCPGTRVGADVIARDFIAAEGAVIDSGTTLTRCFVGECTTLASHFTAVDSLFFANCHCENGEAVSIFAGPCTVSHHKSSLLIAGQFSFFNAGSGSNQSNHLFKSGPVHQAIHLRGTKFGSGAYIMAPAVEGPFTVVLGHHARHHDTRIFPFSYLIENDGRTALMPGANLATYGTLRDQEKWPARDRRTVRREPIDYASSNPYTAGLLVDGLNKLHLLSESNPEADSYFHGPVVIRSVQLRRGVKLYNKAVAAMLGEMLSRGEVSADCDGRGRWSDVAGQYVPRRAVRQLLDALESGAVSSLEEMDARFAALHARYDDYARSWAEELYESLSGHPLTEVERAETIAAGARVAEELRTMAREDLRRDNDVEMQVSYGLEAEYDAERKADFKIVRGLE